MVVYQFDWFYEASYVGMTSRQFNERKKDHIPKSINEFYKIGSKECKFEIVVNASKKSSVAENLVNNCYCASNYSFRDFKLLKTFKAFLI